MKSNARKAPDYLKKSVMYQLFLRAFTPEGTLQSAARLLPHIAELGVDIVYLCPVALADDDERREFWSPRQLKSNINNPKNPYRIKDFYAIDPEYGTEKDLRDFIEKAHGLGLRVILDLVYLHCGPMAVFIDKNPDFVERNAKGEIVLAEFNFPKLNFQSEELKEYLWKNMEYFIREFDVDGYRCDSTDHIPIDFWQEGRMRIEHIRPDVIMLAEGNRPEQQFSAFDLNYSFPVHVKIRFAITGTHKHTAINVRQAWEKQHDEFPKGARFIRSYDTHDITNDCGPHRFEKEWPFEGVNAVLFFIFTLDGVPFLYNGVEVADSAMHSIYANRYQGHNCVINWSGALMDQGRERLVFLKNLIKLRRNMPALTDGDVKWIEHDCPESILMFSRNCNDQSLLCAVNIKNETVSVSCSCDSPVSAVMKKGIDSFDLKESRLEVEFSPYGFIILELSPNTGAD